MSETIHICLSRKDDEKVSVEYCPVCKKRRRFYSWFQEWYGWTSTCSGCGDRWTDGEMHERPFQRNWRKEEIESAKKDIKEYWSKRKPEKKAKEAGNG